MYTRLKLRRTKSNVCPSACLKQPYFTQCMSSKFSEWPKVRFLASSDFLVLWNFDNKNQWNRFNAGNRRVMAQISAFSVRSCVSWCKAEGYKFVRSSVMNVVFWGEILLLALLFKTSTDTSANEVINQDFRLACYTSHLLLYYITSLRTFFIHTNSKRRLSLLNRSYHKKMFSSITRSVACSVSTMCVEWDVLSPIHSIPVIIYMAGSGEEKVFFPLFPWLCRSLLN